VTEFSHVYNLGRLGQAGDAVAIEAGPEERAGLARLAGVLEVPKFSAGATLKKISPSRFEIAYALAAEVIQACVVSLEPLTAPIVREFTRELHFTPVLRHADKEVIVSPADDEVPEEIESLHYDLAGPLVEEFLLAIDPYPRKDGVAFAPPGEAPGKAKDKPESPFAVLKSLKSGR
jgi:uncharacterized metal-binding protein YceD (DUF177 family)